ncbi:branched-chain amino acid ABC transporter permease, partial [Bacillus thuringiensis]|nr:branched-chain amino acid ABC transporter permease [Bacillus thuringiensis]
LYGLLLTFGVAMVIEGGLREVFGATGMPYAPPESLQGIWNLGFAIVPKYRGFVVLASLTVCIGVWLLIEKTKLGAYLRAATENAAMVQ